MIRDLDAAGLPAARAFLEAHAESSLFLLSNLAQFGPSLGDHLSSGNFKVIEEGGTIVGAFCLTKRGNLLAQTGNRTYLAPDILKSCLREPHPIQAVVAEWTIADALWRLLTANPSFRSVHAKKEVLYRLDLETAALPPADPRVRRLTPSDFDAWHPLIESFMSEAGLPLQGTPDQRRAAFLTQASAGHWWGAFDGPALVSTASLNAVYSFIGQVGGVFTPPSLRRRGLSRLTMSTLLRDASTFHRLRLLTLFTGDDNVAARTMYESLGFRDIGRFGLLFGSWSFDKRSI
ncbi:MAG: GNAT family N-acetyltransferase, partial [Bacillota bacterium]